VARYTSYKFRPDPIFCPVCGRPLEQYPGQAFMWLRCPQTSFLGRRHFDEPSDVPVTEPRPDVRFDPFTGVPK